MSRASAPANPSFAEFVFHSGFFRNLFSPYANPAEQMRASAPGGSFFKLTHYRSRGKRPRAIRRSRARTQSKNLHLSLVLYKGLALQAAEKGPILASFFPSERIFRRS
jgi:hypothetical protein